LGATPSSIGQYSGTPIPDTFAQRLTNAASMIYSRLRTRAEDRADQNLDARIPPDLGPEERAFLKRMVATPVGTPPFVASFDLHETNPRSRMPGRYPSDGSLRPRN
jgi:hypothetical protein